MNLDTYHDGFFWITVDTDTYDGAPDSSPKSRIFGVGNSKE